MFQESLGDTWNNNLNCFEKSFWSSSSTYIIQADGAATLACLILHSPTDNVTFVWVCVCVALVVIL